MADRPSLWLIAGPNGSGKTTFVRSGALGQWSGLVPATLLNTDDIARALSSEMPNAAEATRVREAQRRSDALVDGAIAARQSILVETVLSSNKFEERCAAAKQAGFIVAFVFVTLRSAALNLARVADRVAEGGHDVPADRVAARRLRSHANFGWFAAQADLGLLVDNTDPPPRGPALVAELRESEAKWRIYDEGALPELTRSLGP